MIQRSRRKTPRRGEERKGKGEKGEGGGGGRRESEVKAELLRRVRENIVYTKVKICF